MISSKAKEHLRVSFDSIREASVTQLSLVFSAPGQTMNMGTEEEDVGNERYKHTKTMKNPSVGV
jgi:hypothetical protein